MKRPGRMLFRQPLALSIGALCLSTWFALWALVGMSEATTRAARAEANLDRAHGAVQMLSKVVPAHLPPDGSRQFMDHLLTRLAAAGAERESLQSFNVQSLGAPGAVASMRQAGRLELSGLTLRQLAVAIDAVESSGLPVWIESMDLVANSKTQQTWDAAIQVTWLSKMNDRRGER